MSMRDTMSGEAGLRPGWGIALFVAMVVALRFVQYFAFTRQLPPGALGTPGGLLLEEAIRVAIVVFATWVMARIEGRPFIAYGLDGPGKLRLFLLGSALGFITLSVLVGVLAGTGQLTLAWEPTSLSRAIGNGGLWLLAFYAVSLFEELLLRGYLQYTLARGIGFWWAALAWSAVFVWMHTSNSGETWLGLAQIGCIALFFCLSLRLTGSLWWAIGYHALWDWAESFFYGTPNSGNVFQSRLMTAVAHGDPLWSGGAAGPEGSLGAFLVLLLPGLLLVALWWRKRAAR
jgi:membrane protease YdiL (CAAX protease family)